eukprot:gene7094-11257_t
MKEQKLQEDKDELEMEFGSFFDNSDSDDEESEKTKNKFNQKIYRDLIINCFDFKLIEKYHPMFENDEEVLSVAIGSKQNYLKYASEILKKNKHFMIKCVDKFLPKISGEKIFNLKYLKDFLDDKDVIRKLVEKSPGSFSLDNMLEIWKDENFLEECLMINPDLLKYVPVKNMDLTIKTLIQKPEILENYSLTKEQYILLIEQKARISYFHIPLYLKEDMDFMELFLNNCDIPYSIDLKFEDSILKDRNMVKLILQKLPSYLSKLKEKYQNDRELVELAVSCNPKSLVHASMELKDDRELVLFVLENLTKPKTSHYCGKSGEFNKHWEIKECTDGKKGFGVFSLRDFKGSECIMVERPVIKVPKLETMNLNMNILTKSERKIFETLSSSSNDKYVDGRFLKNGFGDDTGQQHLSCNAYHLFDEDNGAKVLVALRKISKGEEITINYCGFFMNKKERAEKLSVVYGINCNCSRCNNPEEEEKIQKMSNFNERLGSLSFQSNTVKIARECIRIVKEMIKLYSSSTYPVSDTQYATTYYEGYQVCGPHTSNHAQGKKWIKLAVDHSKKNGIKFKSYQKYEFYQNYPFEHQMWRISSSKNKTEIFQEKLDAHKNVFEVTIQDRNKTVDIVKGIFKVEGNANKFSLRCSVFQMDNSTQISSIILSPQNRNNSIILKNPRFPMSEILKFTNSSKFRSDLYDDKVTLSIITSKDEMLSAVVYSLCEGKKPKIVEWKKWTMLGVVGVMLVSLVLGLRPPYFTFLFASTIITYVGIIEKRDFLSGFSNEGLLTIAVLFAVVKPVSNTGILQRISQNVLVFKNPRISLFIIMLFVSSLSVFFNNTPIVALFIPIIVDWCDKNNYSPSKFLIPLSFATVVGGMCSLLGTSTNLLVHGFLEEIDPSLGFGFFEVGYVGIFLAIFTILYLFIFAFICLPDRIGLMKSLTKEGKSFIAEIDVREAPKLRGSQVSKLKKKYKIEFIEILRKTEEASERIAPVEDNEKIQRKDVLIISGQANDISKMINYSKMEDVLKRSLSFSIDQSSINGDEKEALLTSTPQKYDQEETNDETSQITTDNDEISSVEQVDNVEVVEEKTFMQKLVSFFKFKESKGPDTIEFFEVVLGHQSPVLGFQVKDGIFQSKYSASVIAMRRDDHKESLQEMEFKSGDAVLILSKSSFYQAWMDSNHFYVISRSNRNEELKKKIKIKLCGKYFNASWIQYLSMPIFIGMIIAATIGVPMFFSALSAFLLLILFGILDGVEAYKSIDWGLIILIGSSFAIGKGIDKSGLSLDISNLILQLNMPNYILPGVLFAITQLLAFTITCNAAAAIAFPFAVSLAQVTGVDLKPLALGVALGASSNFATPIGYQTNLMVQAPGGYNFLDYTRIGLPINLSLVAIAGVLIPLMWNIR